MAAEGRRQPAEPRRGGGATASAGGPARSDIRSSYSAMDGFAGRAVGGVREVVRAGTLWPRASRWRRGVGASTPLRPPDGCSWLLGAARSSRYAPLYCDVNRCRHGSWEGSWGLWELSSGRCGRSGRRIRWRWRRCGGSMRRPARRPPRKLSTAAGNSPPRSPTRRPPRSPPRSPTRSPRTRARSAWTASPSCTARSQRRRASSWPR